ncbi:unnamed protein product [Cuscuta europaea]|uniref:Uncharacterized protein n=1 Tax=Cuscuta europaea TaxID=41803 RepID=A0A9P0YJJ2_CUSEU|nr:unnamed protein product [Cuscuta europaea]
MDYQNTHKKVCFDAAYKDDEVHGSQNDFQGKHNERETGNMNQQKGDHATSGLHRLNHLMKTRTLAGNQIRDRVVMRNIMAAVVLQSKKKQKLERRVKVLEEGMERLFNGQKKQTEMLERLLLTKSTTNEAITSKEEDMDIDKNDTLQRKVHEEVQKKVHEEAFVDDMPSFDLHLSLSQKFDEKIMEKGDSEVEKGDSEVEKGDGEDGEKEGLYGEDAHLKHSQDENEVASDEADPIGAQKDNIILSEEVVLTPAHASINT